MSDDRDPDRTDGPHPDEPRGEGPGHGEAGEAGSAAADPVSPYGPAAPAGAPASAPATPTPTDGTDARTTADAPPMPAAHPAPPAPPAGRSASGDAAAAYDPADPTGAGAAAGAAAPGPGYAPSGPGPGSAPSGPGYAPPAAPPYVSGQPPRPRGGKGLAIAALVVGIAGFVGAFIPVLNYVTAVPALVAVVLAIVSLARRTDGKPLALAGLILGVVGFVLSIVLALVYTFAFVSSVSDAIETADPGSGFASPEPTSGDDDATALPGTSPDDPLPIGTPVTGDGIDGPEWQVTLGTPILDATAAVLAAEEGNPPPADGMQYAVVPVTATYLGTTEGDPLSELAVGFLAADGSQYSAADSFALAPAPAFTDNEELLEPQGTATGNVVIEIPIDGAADGLWATAPGMIADAYYFRAG
ncbi:DUF4190 domain-containing protein [Clavibacter sepedonicus]|uniref:Membrane protein n=2 Tax=Clavibacter TaxID=1573 RepID=B0RAK0_CLASE|nr:DUF4190 domain-containing protein [Clavibacter sepedonicus]OQJ48810.1 hypothetical protein B5P19_11545 [Clavibacter sepedonicus]OQJ54356.1 hypothetical protein B5P20_09730 [Clavibacter sepedonicus]UUK65914.1 DUF4190 domain-containing protein [Clavibacter sepedonicus]CAQ00368.1 putative membrane protein [Clavibacter sepedonicus]